MKGFRLVALITLAFSFSACASLTVQQRLSAGRQTVRAAIVAVDELELRLCAPNPAKVNTCTAEPRILEDVQHQRLSALLAKAYDEDAAATIAIRNWSQDLPVPTSLATLQASLQALHDEIAGYKPNSRITELLGRARAAVELANQLAKLAGGGAPLPAPDAEIPDTVITARRLVRASMTAPAQ